MVPSGGIVPTPLKGGNLLEPPAAVGAPGIERLVDDYHDLAGTSA